MNSPFPTFEPAPEREVGPFCSILEQPGSLDLAPAFPFPPPSAKSPVGQSSDVNALAPGRDSAGRRRGNSNDERQSMNPAHQPALQFGAEPQFGLKEFWVCQDFTIRLGPGAFRDVFAAPQRYFTPDPITALAYFQIGMSRRFLEERMPIVQWLGQPQIREASLV